MTDDGSIAEFRGILAEAHYAMRFAGAGYAVSPEPTGRRGPDFRIDGAAIAAYVELKRLTLTDHVETNDDVADWYDNEAKPSSSPRGSEQPTLRLLACVRDAESQLVHDTLNVVVVHDFSLEVTRSAFLDATKAIEIEAA